LRDLAEGGRIDVLVGHQETGMITDWWLRRSCTVCRSLILMFFRTEGLIELAGAAELAA
jgi:hypothetical protein